MIDINSIPDIESFLPGFMAFAAELQQEVELGEIDAWPEFRARVSSYFTLERIEAFEAVVPGWKEMASYSNGITLVHVTCAFAVLLNLPEYQGASPAQQAALKWVVLFHDVAKKVIDDHRDYVHSFRSAVIAAQNLPRLGFAVTSEYQAQIEAWANLTYEAFIPEAHHGHDSQDNRELPEIITGIERLFGKDTPGALIVGAILLHSSINVVAAWPQGSPLDDAEIKAHVSPALLPLLKAMMLTDNYAWMFYDPAEKASQREETMLVFDAVEKIVLGQSASG